MKNTSPFTTPPLFYKFILMITVLMLMSMSTVILYNVAPRIGWKSTSGVVTAVEGIDSRSRKSYKENVEYTVSGRTYVVKSFFNGLKINDTGSKRNVQYNPKSVDQAIVLPGVAYMFFFSSTAILFLILSFLIIQQRDFLLRNRDQRYSWKMK